MRHREPIKIPADKPIDPRLQVPDLDGDGTGTTSGRTRIAASQCRYCKIEALKIVVSSVHSLLHNPLFFPMHYSSFHVIFHLSPTLSQSGLAMLPARGMHWQVARQVL